MLQLTERQVLLKVSIIHRDLLDIVIPFIWNLLDFNLASLLPICPILMFTSRSADQNNNAWLSYFLQSFLLTFTLSLVLYLTYLQKCCMQSCSKLCTLMLYDASRDKRHFIPIVRGFSEDRCCCRLFHAIPFKTTNLLSVIGWSISAQMIASSLLNTRDTSLGAFVSAPRSNKQENKRQMC